MVCGRANQQLVITNNKNIPYSAGLVKRFFRFFFSAAPRDIFCNFCSAGLDKTIRFRYTYF